MRMRLRTGIVHLVDRFRCLIGPALPSEAERRLHRLEDALQERLFTLEALLTSHAPAVKHAGGRSETPAVSVIIPTRNRCRHLVEAVDSVKAQTFSQWELIIVDDGSTDDTPDVARGLATDERIKYIRIDAGDVAAARNAGLTKAAGELIAYLDDDNIWYPEFLAAAVVGMAENPDSELAYGALVSVSPGKSVSPIMWKRFDWTDLLRENFIDANVIVHRRTTADKYGGWDEKLGYFEDWDIALRYTIDRPPLQLPVLAAIYRSDAPFRMSARPDLDAPFERFRKKWPVDPAPPAAGGEE